MRGGRAGARLVGKGTRKGTERFREFAASDGARESGLARLTEVHLVATAADAAFTIALASTVLALPVGQARGQVALFLLTTMVPFVFLSPLIGPILDRYRHGRRWALGATLAVRAFLSWVLAGLIVEGSVWLLPIALVCLVATRAYAVTTAAAIPRVVPDGVTLVKANSRQSIAALIGMVLGSAVAGLAGRIGPEWALRVAFAIYVVATVLAITLPAAVDSRAAPAETDPEPTDDDLGVSGSVVGEADPRPDADAWAEAAYRAMSGQEGAEAAYGVTPGQEGAEAAYALGVERPIRRWARWRPQRILLPPTVRAALVATSGSRALAGFLTLFAGFLMSERPPEGVSDIVALGAVVGAAGLGNATGGFLGNRLGRRAPLGVATGMLVLATLAALATAISYSLVTIVALGLVTGAFGQLARLCLGALVQAETDEETHSRVFAQTETTLQGAWVFGGGVGIILPLIPQLGFGIVALILIAALGWSIWIHRTAYVSGV
jgi:MFS family permease